MEKMMLAHIEHNYYWGKDNEILIKNGGSKEIMKRCAQTIGKRFKLLLEPSFIDNLKYLTLKKGTILYHGSKFRIEKFPRDDKEMRLETDGLITHYKGAWFSFDPEASLKYALRIGKKKYDQPLKPAIYMYELKEDIHGLLNIDIYREYGRVCSEEIIKDLKKKIKCIDESLINHFLEGPFWETNFYLSALICKCSDIEGWVHLGDDYEVFLCEPSKFLKPLGKLKIKRIKTWYGTISLKKFIRWGSSTEFDTVEVEGIKKKDPKYIYPNIRFF